MFEGMLSGEEGTEKLEFEVYKDVQKPKTKSQKALVLYTKAL